MLQTNTGSLHNALGQPRMILLTGVIQVALLLPMILFATFKFGLDGTAWAVLAHAVVVGLPTTYWIVFGQPLSSSVTLLKRAGVLLSLAPSCTEWRTSFSLLSSRCQNFCNRLARC